MRYEHYEHSEIDPGKRDLAAIGLPRDHLNPAVACVAPWTVCNNEAYLGTVVSYGVSKAELETSG